MNHNILDKIIYHLDADSVFKLSKLNKSYHQYISNKYIRYLVYNTYKTYKTYNKALLNLNEKSNNDIKYVIRKQFNLDDIHKFFPQVDITYLSNNYYAILPYPIYYNI
jgi:hypothetical protein